MNKKIQTAIVTGIIFLCVNTFGQTMKLAPEMINGDPIKSRYHVGFLINVASTTLNYGASNTAFTDYKKSINGLQIGASFQNYFTTKFSLVSELYFMMKGGKLRADNPLSIQKSTLRFYTIESLLLTRFNVGKVYLNAGPSIAYNLFATRKIGDESSKSISFKHSVEGFKRWDAGIQMGGGYQFNTKQKRVVIDIRYTYGLSNISYDEEIYNRTVNIGLHVSRLR